MEKKLKKATEELNTLGRGNDQKQRSHSVINTDDATSKSIFKVKPVKYKAFSNDKQGCIR